MGHMKRIATERMEDEWLAEAAREAAENDRIYAEIAAKVTAENEAYAKQWPNHCKTCGGWGQQSWTENQSPLGSGENWPETFTEPCDNCYAAGKCGRCGHELKCTDDGEPIDSCDACGWRSGQNGLQQAY